METNGRNELLKCKYWAYWDKEAVPWYMVMEYTGQEIMYGVHMYNFKTRKSGTEISFTIAAFEQDKVKPFLLDTQNTVKTLEELD